MAESRQRNIVERLADAGEEAIQRIGTAPGADRLLGPLNALRERMDDLQKRVRGLESLDKRLAAVERRLDELEGGTPAKPSAKPSPPRKRSSGSSST
jgi:hypothetical protein